MLNELTILALSALLALALPLLYAPFAAMRAGLPALIGNREDKVPEGPGARGQRAHANLTENLVPFAIAVLTAHAMGVHNDLTILGAQIFLVARIVHALSYIAGIKIVRTLSYAAGLIGTVMILLQLF